MAFKHVILVFVLFVSHFQVKSSETKSPDTIVSTKEQYLDNGVLALLIDKLKNQKNELDSDGGLALLLAESSKQPLGDGYFAGEEEGSLVENSHGVCSSAVNARRGRERGATINEENSSSRNHLVLDFPRTQRSRPSSFLKTIQEEVLRNPDLKKNK